ncbi:hypothetical protein AAMO2058_001733000 [Amorphochlora amoebiformis]
MGLSAESNGSEIRAPGTGIGTESNPGLGSRQGGGQGAASKKAKVGNNGFVVQKMVAGGTAGAISRTCVAPLDRMKILFQTQTDPPKYRGVLHALSVITKEEGVLGLWRGNFANCFRIIPKTAVQYGSFAVWRPLADKYLSMGITGSSKSNKTSKGVSALGKVLSAGMLAGLTAQIVTYPLDTVRARLTVDAGGKLNGMFGTLFAIIRHEGFPALYKGIFPTLCGSVPYVGIEFSVYATLKASAYIPKLPNSTELTVLGKLFCGGAAAMVGQTITYPFDLIRRRMQVAGYSQEMRSFFALYKGLWPNYLKSVPAVAITWLVYEEMMEFLT